MTSLLLNIHPDRGHRARLAAAITIVKSGGGHLACIQALTPPYAMGDAAGAVSVAEAIEATEQAARQFQEEVEVALDQAEVERTWIRVYGEAAATIVSQSRLADAILLSSQGSYPSVGSVAVNARAGIIAVPETLSDFHSEIPVVIAWNGSHPCANAMRASVPLLRIARSVHLLVIDKDDEEFPAARALDYLSHHEIESAIHRLQGGGGALAASILSFTREVDAGLIIAGAFGHNRVREMLLGSVTRELLKNSRLPLFLAH